LVLELRESDLLSAGNESASRLFRQQ